MSLKKYILSKKPKKYLKQGISHCGAYSVKAMLGACGLDTKARPEDYHLYGFNRIVGTTVGKDYYSKILNINGLKAETKTAEYSFMTISAIRIFYDINLEFFAKISETVQIFLIEIKRGGYVISFAFIISVYPIRKADLVSGYYFCDIIHFVTITLVIRIISARFQWDGQLDYQIFIIFVAPDFEVVSRHSGRSRV